MIASVIAAVLTGLRWMARNPDNLQAMLGVVTSILVWVKTTQTQLAAAGTLSADQVKTDAQLAAAVGLAVKAETLEQHADELLAELRRKP